jgi:hypothetical protein
MAERFYGSVITLPLSMFTSRFRLTETPGPRTPLSTTQFYTPFSAYAASPTTPTPSQFTAHPRTPSNPKQPYREEADENCVLVLIVLYSPLLFSFVSSFTFNIVVLGCPFGAHIRLKILSGSRFPWTPFLLL